MTPSETVTDILINLCLSAGVDPEDGSDRAGRTVLDALRERGAFGYPGFRPVHCPVNAWVRRRCGFPAVVTTLTVVLPQVVTGLRPQEPQRTSVGRQVAPVPLPAAVRAAVRLMDTDTRLRLEVA